MQGMPYTPSEAVRIVARAHARLVERGADYDSAVRLVADQHGLRLKATRWAVARAREFATPVAHHGSAPPAVPTAMPPATPIEPIRAFARRA